MRVVLHPEARRELHALPIAEQDAIRSVIDKLTTATMLGMPHTSHVQGSRTGLRELRPRGGRSRWRALYRRIGQRFVLLAIAPEAGLDRHGFSRGVRTAERRLLDIEEAMA